jgi:hypothetical protein
MQWSEYAEIAPRESKIRCWASKQRETAAGTRISGLVRFNLIILGFDTALIES